jgi:hypothetical protein
MALTNNEIIKAACLAACDVKELITLANLHGLIDRDCRVVPVPADLQYGWAFDSEAQIARVIANAFTALLTEAAENESRH